MAKSSFSWDMDTLTPALEVIDDATDRFVTATMAMHAPRAEAFAKREASWTDRTSNARNGLFATSERGSGVWRIIVAHGVPYGIWLEVRFSGRYAIIQPTIAHEGPEVMKTIAAGYWAGLIGGI